MIFKGYLFSILYALFCLGFGFGLYKLCVSKKITRKIVHILVGAEWIILYHFFGGGIHFLLVCLAFLLVLALAHRRKLLPMISSDGDNSPGTVYYALAMSIMALLCLFVPDMMVPFGIGVFCTSLGDGFAGLMGQWINTPRNHKIYGNKTLYGSIFCFMLCFITAGVFNAKFSLGLEVWHILAIAFFATELELITTRGLDNVTVTLGSSLLAYFFISCEWAGDYLAPILLTPLLIAFAYKKQALTIDGIIAAVIVDLVISISFANLGFAILLVFFIGGLITDKIKNGYKSKGRKQKSTKKASHDKRSYRQVLANALVAALCGVGYILSGQALFVVAFAASLAEALADTAASGIGVICGRAYDPFRRQSCTPGISGGMSLLGTASSAIAALIVAALAFGFEAVNLTAAVIIAISAFLGAAFDSLLGSLLQVKYRCSVCGSITERLEHCFTPTRHHSGLGFVTNNSVNLISTLFSASLAAILYILM